MSIFKNGNFILASGKQSNWKIDCDDLTDEDWETLALMASEILPSFGSVEGVPTGGLKFAAALSKYITKGPPLIAEDVVTTGASMERIRDSRIAIGVAVFSRGRPPAAWIYPIFEMDL